MIKVTYRCNCYPEPILAERNGNSIFTRRKGFEVYMNPPIDLSCGNCRQWYNINKDFKMVPRTTQDIKDQSVHVCIYCNYAFTPATIKQKCPKCGKVQATTNLALKQTR